MDTPATSWITLFAVVAGFLYQGWRAERQRHWEIEDRAILAAAVKTEAGLVATKVQDVADKVIAEAGKVSDKVIADADAAKLHRVELLDAIHENTEISTKAFHEANTVNLKLEKLGLEHNKLEKETKTAIEDKKPGKGK